MLQATARVVQMLHDSGDAKVLGLALGRLLSDIEELIDRGAHAQPPGAADDAARGGGLPRMWLWSGHDTTIIPVLLMLGQDVARWPPYTSSVVRLCASLRCAPLCAVRLCALFASVHCALCAVRWGCRGCGKGGDVLDGGTCAAALGRHRELLQYHF